MGKGDSPEIAACAEPQKVITPAVARSISQDTANAQAVQANQRASLKGIGSTYNRFKSSDGSGSQTLGGA